MDIENRTVTLSPEEAEIINTHRRSKRQAVKLHYADIMCTARALGLPEILQEARRRYVTWWIRNQKPMEV